MNRFFSVFVACVLALCVASPVFADDVSASSSAVASSVPGASSSVASSVPAASSAVASSVPAASSSVASSVPAASSAPATIIEKPLSDYTPTEGLLLVICVQLVFFLLFALLKWRFA